MSGVLPPILGGARTGFVDSRPTSNTSVASTTYTSVPHIFYNNKISDKQTGVSKSPRRFDLPSLRHSWAGPAPNPQDVESTYSARYRSTPTFGPKLTADTPFLPKPSTEDCMKCLLKIKHKKCESHKYVRIGGGYRHGYWYVKCLLEELEIQRQRALIAKQRLEAIHEKRVRAVKTYIRTKSGKLVERIVFLSEEDYQAFKEGKNAKDILKKYLSKDEAQGLQKWDKDEVKAIKTYVRTKSGRVVEKLVYVSSKDYDAIKDGKVDANKILKKYVKTGEGEEIQGWGEAKMKQIKTYVRTKSGKLIEKTIMISQEDYDAMIKDGKDPEDILKKYIPLDDGQKLESWKSSEPMKAIKTKVRTKSGRIIEKTIFVSQDDYDAMTKGGGDANKILSKYLKDEDGVEVESWEKADTNPMKVVKTYIRTKSGRVIEKDILLTEDEYRQFQETGGDPNFLKKFVNLNKGEEIEDWEKASTVYSASDDADIKGAKHGQRIVGKDGNVYEVVVDPLTGKKYKKKVGMKESDVDSGIASLNKGRKGRKGGKGGGNDGYDDESPRERARRKQGKRDEHSDSEYSYRSVVSAGGRRHVKRRKKLANGTYASDESYHSSQDEEGAARRRRRRRERRHGADSAHSYYSVKSAGGTRHVKRRRKKADGTYSASESYHSSDSDLPGGGLARKGKKKKKHRVHGSDSEHSYFTDVSEGGTKTRRRKKRIKDKDGKVIGYASSESYSSDSSEESSYESMSDGKGGRVRVKKPKLGKGKDGRRRGISKPVFSDASTDSDAVDLENMTEEEKEKYFKEKAIRKAEREKRRREKYGDKYDEMLAKHEKRKKEIKEIKEEEKKQKEERRKDRERRRQLGEIVSSSDEDDGKGGKKKKTAKSMVTYGKGSRREILDPIKRTDSREPGLGPEQWGGKKGRQRKNKDGHEADDESDEVTREEGERFVDEDGNVCVVEKDPETGKLTTRVIGQNKKSKQKKGGTDTNGMTLEEIQMFKEGHRQQDSDSDYSYRSIVSPGGTRRVRRRRKRDDGTYSNSDSYNSDDDEDGKARRRIRRRNRRHGSGSAHSYYSVESEGGTRHVRRRRKREDGTYSDSESHHSPDEDIATFFKEKSKIVNKKSKPGNVFEPDAGYESDCSVKSVVSVGGTRRVVKKKRIRDKSGNVVGYGDPEPLKPGEQEYLQKRQNQTLNTNEPDFVPDENYDSDYSVKSVISDGGTRHHVKQKRIRDESGNVVGYGEKQSLKDGEKAFLLKRKGIDAALAYRNGRRLKEMQKTDDGVGENVKRNSTNENQTSSKMLSVKPRKNRKGYEKDTTQIDLRDLNKDLNMPNYSKRLDTTPLDFSDASSEDDVDLSKMTEEEREQYLSDKMKRQTEREKRRREKYGSRYDEIMKNRERKRLEREEREKIERLNQMREESRTRLRLPSSNRTLSSLGNLAPSRSSSSLNKSKEIPKSMVTYEKGTPRRLSWPNQDVKEHSRSHLRENRRSREDSSTRLKGDASKQYTGKMPPLPPIPQGRILERLGTTDVKDLNQLRKKRGRTNLSSLTSEDYTFVSNTEIEEDDRNLDNIREDTVQQEKISPFDVDTSGKVTLKKGKKKIDLNDVTPEMLKQLGIDPNLSKKEIASLLKKKFGQNLIVTDGGTFIGTKGIGEYRKDVTDIELIEDPHLDTSTLKGVRRVNVLFKRGGEQLAEHLQRIVQEANSNLFRKLDYAKDLDEKDASIDFLNHYRLVDPRRIENYAKAFVVEDGDLDSVINNLDTKIALSGVQQLQEMTDKQVKYVLKVLHIDDASQVTFRMFAVISALCERITSMDSLSKYLLEMCNLGDLERKMDLYKAMFYHNIESDRDPNHITAESLKIELIAGGLNWKQRKYILRQMVPNKFGDISFLDYITYIPLFLSIHDNICENPLDSSTQKYCMPPRKRPPSSQRDLNPLGCPLSKRSSYLMNKQAKDLIEGRLKSAHFRKEHLEMVRQFQKLSDNALSNKLNGIFHPTVREDTQMSLHDKIDLIY